MLDNSTFYVPHAEIPTWEFIREPTGYLAMRRDHLCRRIIASDETVAILANAEKSSVFI